MADGADVSSVVAVGSTNPVKVRAVEKAFAAAFPGREFVFTSYGAPSGVPDQPVGDEETRRGAITRAKEVLTMSSMIPDFCVGLEGGVLDVEEDWSGAAGIGGLLGGVGEGGEEEGEEEDGEKGSSGVKKVRVMRCMAWMAVLHVSSGVMTCERTATLRLPASVASLVRQGVELGVADDRVFGRTDSKRKSGSVGLLTRGICSREEYYTHALVLALVPFLWPDQYGTEKIHGAKEMEVEE